MSRWLQEIGMPVQDTALVVATVGTITSAVFNVQNVALLIALIVVFVLDMLAGMAKCYIRNPDDWYDGQVMIRGVVRKLLMMALVVLAGMIDSLAILVPSFSTYVIELTPITKAVLCLMLVGQMGSVLKNIRRAGVRTPALDLLVKRIGGEESKEIPAVKREPDTK